MAAVFGLAAVAIVSAASAVMAVRKRRAQRMLQRKRPRQHAALCASSSAVQLESPGATSPALDTADLNRVADGYAATLAAPGSANV